MDIVRDLIKRRLDEIDVSMTEASIRIGRNPSYIQQFVTRGVPEELRERDRHRLAEILGVSEEVLRGKSPPLLAKSRPNNTATTAARNGSQDMSGSRQNFLESVRPLPIMPNRDLPVFGTAEGGNGALIVTSEPVDWEARPDILARKKTPMQ